MDYVLEAAAGVHGSFKKALYNAMAYADSDNLERFRAAFPADWARFKAYMAGYEDPDEQNEFYKGM